MAAVEIKLDFLMLRSPTMTGIPVRPLTTIAILRKIYMNVDMGRLYNNCKKKKKIDLCFLKKNLGANQLVTNGKRVKGSN